MEKLPYHFRSHTRPFTVNEKRVAFPHVRPFLVHVRLSLTHIVILSGRKRPMCETPQPEQVGAGPKDLIPRICDDSFPRSLPYPLPRIVIPSEAEGSLWHCRHMYKCVLTQTTPWCFLFRLSLPHGLPVCKKAPSTSVRMTFKKNG